MDSVTHAMPPPGRTSRRLAGLTLALLFQVGFIAALVYGLHVNGVLHDNGGLVAKFIPTVRPDHPPPPPNNPTLVEPARKPMPEPPRWDTDYEHGDKAITLPPVGPALHTGIPDRIPIAVAATHTIPPYPPLAARLGQEGTVFLRLAISPQGMVVDAVVTRSSGFPMLDEAARAWVLAHWRYQPAIRGGAAAPGVANVAVNFNLKNAG